MFQFKPEEFFDLASFLHADIFDGVKNVWEALPRIGGYISKHFELKKMQLVRAASISRFADIGRNVSIGEGSVVGPMVVIEGPAIIGKNVTLKPYAYIRQNVIIGDDCTVAAEIKNSVLFPGTEAAHRTIYIGDSILGHRAHLGSGVVLSNLKTPRGVINILDKEGARISTGLEKFGAILGDDVEIGCNAVINPGTLFGPKSDAYPLTSVRGTHLSYTRLKLRQEVEVVSKRR
ncbi:UDP-N-acetylglucosamine diphosphorylase [bacterium]|nr:UDP-N-acetylglucosamine diphosphorylase [bacterium]